MSNSSLINNDELSEYSQIFAKRLSDYFFIDHSFITGQEIMQFCDIKQVNLLIIKNLFETWQEETANLKSPYFDYSHEKVQVALKTFMNTLSNYIHIGQEDFTPLLAQATEETLLLILSPYDFYQKEFKKNIYTPLTSEQLQANKKYIRNNKSFFEKIIEQVNAQGREVSQSDALQILTSVDSQMEESIEPIEWEIKDFSDIIPIDLDKIYKGRFDSETLNGTDETTIIATDEQNFNFVNNTNDNIIEATIFQEKINDTYEVDEKFDYKILNDSVAKEERPTVLDHFQQAKIDNLRKSISINEKFLFINELFAGDSLGFNEALDKLDTCSTYNEARQLMNQAFAIKYNWNFEDENVRKFMELVRRKFD